MTAPPSPKSPSRPGGAGGSLMRSVFPSDRLMAALLFSVAGAAAGSALLGPAGAIAGRIVGTIAGNVIDHSLFGTHTTNNVEGPRLSDLEVVTSTEGAPIPRLYGRARLGGQMIWATRLEEVVSTGSETAGGKGGSGGTSTTNTTT